MELIKILTDSDFLGGTPVLINAVSRYASRGVLVNRECNVAMMHLSNENLYKLPGGGIEEGETEEEAFLREIKEETGFEAEIIRTLGYIDEHKNCFAAKALTDTGHLHLSYSEIEDGMELKWMPLEQAAATMKRSAENCTDYSSRFMIQRDLCILEHALPIITDLMYQNEVD